MRELDLMHHAYLRPTAGMFVGLLTDAVMAARAWFQFQRVRAESNARLAVWQLDQVTKPRAQDGLPGPN